MDRLHLQGLFGGLRKNPRLVSSNIKHGLHIYQHLHAAHSLRFAPPVDQHGQGCGSSTGQCCPPTPVGSAFSCWSFQGPEVSLQSPTHTEHHVRIRMQVSWFKLQVELGLTSPLSSSSSASCGCNPSSTSLWSPLSPGSNDSCD